MHRAPISFRPIRPPHLGHDVLSRGRRRRTATARSGRHSPVADVGCATARSGLSAARQP